MRVKMQYKDDVEEGDNFSQWLKDIGNGQNMITGANGGKFVKVNLTYNLLIIQS